MNEQTNQAMREGTYEGDVLYQREHANDGAHSEALFPNEDPKVVFADLLSREDSKNWRALKLDHDENIAGFQVYQLTQTLADQGSRDYLRVPVGQAIVEFVTTTRPLERHCHIYFPNAKEKAGANADRLSNGSNNRVRRMVGQPVPSFDIFNAAGKLSHAWSNEELENFQLDIVNQVAEQNDRRLPDDDYPTSVLYHVLHKVDQVNKEDNRKNIEKPEETDEETPLAK